MRLRHVLQIAATVATLLFASVAVWVSQSGDARAGVELDLVHGVVLDASPTGFAWRAGVRAGQVVIDVRRADEPGGWHLQTVGPAGPIVAADERIVEILRELAPLAVFSLVAAGLGLLFLRTNRRWALPAIAVSLVASSVPLDLANHDLAAPTLALAAIVPAGAATWRFRGLPLVAAGTAAGATLVLLAWYLSREAGSESAESLEHARRMVAVGGSALLIADRAVQRDRAWTSNGWSWRRIGAAAAVPVLGIGSLVLVYFATPAPLYAVLGLVALLGLPPLWSTVGPRVQAALMADLRELAASDAAEEERARIARELHDVTLQGLSAAIRRLELVPQAKTETASLRAIADDLRAVAIELRPPMLDDLGLGATLDYLAEQASTNDSSGVAIRTAIVDETGIDVASRPPAAVELALYRIAQEALSNALRHARATDIRITARIAKHSIELEVADDGVGLRPEVQRRAMGQGRLGLASMRRRARAIGADIAIEGSPTGTKVSLTWQG